MSGYPDQAEEKRQQILRFALRILDGHDSTGAVEKERNLIDQISASEVINLIDDLVRQEIPLARLKTAINKLLNLFHKSLSRQDQKMSIEQPLLAKLIQNNQRALSVLDILGPLVTSLQGEMKNSDLVLAIREQLQILLRYCLHYTVKERAIFPKLEALWPNSGYLSVMCSFHDDIRQDLKKALDILAQIEPDLSLFNRQIGLIFFTLSAIIFREEKILYPHMLSTLDESDWLSMTHSSLELEWPFETPDTSLPPETPSEAVIQKEVPLDLDRDLVDLGSGRIDIQQLSLLFRHLPLDLTLVDEHDQVVFFSEGKRRITPRSRSIIGQLIQNYYPPESLAAVEKIIRAFRLGERDQTDFWINMPQGKVLIRYIAIRDDDKRYRGVLEIAQEIGEIQRLTGENPIPSWSSK